MSRNPILTTPALNIGTFRRAVLGLSLGLAMGCQAEHSVANHSESSQELGSATNEASYQLERFVQEGPSKLDVLFVVDDTSTMYPYQTLLAANMDRFMGYLLDSSTDWHVGVITTDMQWPNESGRLRSTEAMRAQGQRYLDETTPDPIGTLAELAKQGTGGYGFESGLLASYTALEVLRHFYNMGFYRETADLAIIVISDEEDQNHGQITTSEYISWLENLKPGNEKVTFNAIVQPDPPTESRLDGLWDSFEPTAYEYLAVVDTIGGNSANINWMSWSETLETIGLESSGLLSEFFLAQHPVQETLEVTVTQGTQTVAFDEGDCEDDCYTYDPIQNSIRFNNYPPPGGSQITVKYELAAE